jgi:hypothetical protein
LNKKSAQNKNTNVTTASRKPLFHPKASQTNNPNKLPQSSKHPAKTSRVFCLKKHGPHAGTATLSLSN